MLVFRITRAEWANALIGSGAPGRWNIADDRVVYSASSRALACLEILVNAGKSIHLNQFRLLEIEIPDGLIAEEIPLRRLPTDWSRHSNMKITQSIGHTWQSHGNSGILKVPSAIIVEEANYVLNTEHIDFKSIHIKSSRAFDFDNRFGNF